MVNDITKQKKAEKERERAYQEMERALKQERVFKLKAAHHFFNPISIAKGYMDLTMDELSEEEKKRIKAAYDAIMRIESVVKNVVRKGEIHE